MKVLFLYLKAFSFTGGIEKFNRCFLKALNELSIDGAVDAQAISAYDKNPNEKYFHRTRFTGWNSNRFLFSVNAVIVSFSNQIVVLGHINLSPIGWLIKKIKPRVRVILIIHGIEAWKPLYGMKRKNLQTCDMILSVSEFTKKKLIEHNGQQLAQKIKVFPNAIDPYFAFPTNFERPKYLLDRYNIKPEEKILLTITRLSSSEKYKGYDHVIAALASPQLKDKKVKYLLCGKSDEKESQRIKHLIAQEKLETKIQLTGFVLEEELTDHYLLADIFVMPSKKEGFGIVFIEASACGLSVIAGSKDGSGEALLHGELGTLIDPDSVDELISALGKPTQDKQRTGLQLQRRVKENFGFPVYKENLRRFLREV